MATLIQKGKTRERDAYDRRTLFRVLLTMQPTRLQKRKSATRTAQSILLGTVQCLDERYPSNDGAIYTVPSAYGQLCSQS